MKTISKHKSLVIFITTVIICAFSILGGTLDYAGNDDTFRNLISAGAFGKNYSFYIPNSNILYGVPAYLLNMILPQVNWYYWLMVSLNVLSISAFCSICLEKFGLTVSEFATVLINIMLARDFYIALQYTKSASLWISAGFIIIVHSLFKKNRHWIWGALLFLSGVAGRFNCFLMALPFIAVFSFLIYLEKRDQPDSINLKDILKPVITVAVGIIVLIAAEHSFRAIHPDWKAYWEYDKASVNLRDYMCLDYQHDPDKYNSINTDENDIALFSKWLFGDTDFYTTSWLKKVYSIENRCNNTHIRVTADTIKDTFIKLFDVPTRVPAGSLGPVFITWICIILLLFRKKYISKAFAIINLGGLAAIYWYFACIGRFMWRAELGVYISVLFLSCYYLSRSPKIITIASAKKIRTLSVSIALILMGIFTIFMTYQWRYVKDKHLVAHEADISGRLETFKENRDSFYLLTDFYVTNNPISITHSKWHDLYSNSCYLGNWIMPSPTALYYANKNNIENPMTSLLGDKTVLLYSDSDDTTEMITKHLEKITMHSITTTEVSENTWKFENK